MCTLHNLQKQSLAFQFQILDLNVEWDFLFLNFKNDLFHIFKYKFVILALSNSFNIFYGFKTSEVIKGSIKAEKVFHYFWIYSILVLKIYVTSICNILQQILTEIYFIVWTLCPLQRRGERVGPFLNTLSYISLTYF